jgi:hypothetical protein
MPTESNLDRESGLKPSAQWAGQGPQSPIATVMECESVRNKANQIRDRILNGAIEP